MYGTGTILCVCNNCCTKIFLTVIVKWLFLIGWLYLNVSLIPSFPDTFFDGLLSDKLPWHVYSTYIREESIQIFFVHFSTIVLCIVAKMVSRSQQYCCKKRKEKNLFIYSANEIKSFCVSFVRIMFWYGTIFNVRRIFRS